MDIKLSSHGAYRHQYHVVWIPKYRKKVLVDEVKILAEKYIREVNNYHPDVHVIQMNIQPDHVHLILEIPPRYSVSEIIGKMKQNSGRKIRKAVRSLRKVYWEEGVFWSPGFFSSTVGIDEDEIRKYVENQEEIDKGEYQLRLFKVPRA